MAASYQLGPVKIIPASVMRDNTTTTTRLYASSQQLPAASSTFQPSATSMPIPINVAYYTNPAYQPGYGIDSGAGAPYGHNAYIDGGIYPSSAAAYYGPAGGYFRSPSPPQYRRSRTAPPPPPPPPMRTFTRQVYPPMYGGARMVRSSRAGMSSFDQQQQQQRYYRSFSGPVKNPAPIYRKRREPSSRFQETEFVGPPPIDPTFAYAPTLSRRYYYGGGGYSIDQQQQQQPTLLRRTRPYYAPSYTTATRQRRRRRDFNDEDAQRYPTWARVILKFAQLIVAAAILGLVLGPMRGQSFHDFVILTRTEWQGAVVGLVASFAILTLMLLVSGIFLAVSQPVWRQIDAVISSGAVFSYLFVACLESYYAACYPPLGADIRVVCYRAEWIIAAILCFINLVLYIIDLVLAFRTGVSVL